MHASSRISFCLELVVAAALVGLASPAAAAGEDAQLDRLVEMMTGSFDSGAQAAADTNFLSIDLHMVPVWPDAGGGRWLYVEQARSLNPESPYRQRLYRLQALDEGVFRSQVYTLENPQDWVGAWKIPSRLDGLSREDIDLREGCAVYLRAEGDAFVGRTRGEECDSDLHGAAFATSEVRISDGRIESLDRGFDEEGELVWGSEFGPYVFVRDEEGGVHAARSIVEMSRRFSTAFVAQDLDTLAEIYAEDAVLLPPGRELHGREAATAWFETGGRYQQLAHSMDSHRLDLHGDTAVDVGTWTSTSQRANQEPRTVSGRYLVVWERGRDGVWRIAYDVWHNPTED